MSAPREGLESLAESWRAEAKYLAALPVPVGDDWKNKHIYRADALSQCAHELEAALNAAQTGKDSLQVAPAPGETAPTPNLGDGSSSVGDAPDAPVWVDAETMAGMRQYVETMKHLAPVGRIEGVRELLTRCRVAPEVDRG